MKFDAVTIKNFRNFEDITINLTNKNVLFGMNDVGMKCPHKSGVENIFKSFSDSILQESCS